MPLEPTALTDAMQQAFSAEWLAVKGSPMPEAGAEDRRLLLAAVARGLLTYLKAQEKEFIKSVTLEEPAGAMKRTVTELDLNISTE